MRTEIQPSFAFLVVTFNHQEYILEHLESIKYLVLTHGLNFDVDLIVNDDCSRDQTRTLVDHWLVSNAKIFRYVKTIYNPKNLGTCASIANMLKEMVADRCKITAGDDVYSFENIFELTQHNPDVAMVSGRALSLIDNLLQIDRLSNHLATATELIYEDASLLHRFKHFSYNNAPNLMYATECLLHPNVREYLGEFDVTEDWPLQIAIARQFPKRRHKLINEVLVYYRRTAGSTYIVANQRFTKDKIKIYSDLIQQENCWFERMRLRSRHFCFISNSQFVNKFANIDFYLFLASYGLKVLRISKRSKIIEISVEKHRRHYAEIKVAAQAIRNEMQLNT
jgi:glycosyltransferase involved in cell wall biosynthesis